MPVSLNPSALLSGQGIDVASLVQQLISQSSGQLSLWQNEQTTLQIQAGDLTAINTDLSSLATAVQALSDPLGALTAQSASSSDTAVFTASATSAAAAGTHQIVVSNLASAGLVYTNDFSAGANASILGSGVTSGEIDLQIGGATPVPITITAGTNDTLSSLASSINGQNLGVTASVVTDANGSRLALVSQSTGTAGALAITSNSTNLVFNPPTGGTNASLTIDGVPFSSASNTISGAISGVTLNLASAAPNTPVQLTVGVNNIQITQAINNFVAAYNQIIGDINQQYTVNASTHQEGPLGSDGALRDVQSSLLNNAAYSISGNSGYINLASLGINTNNDGTLTVDSTQLNSVLSSNPSAVQNFFQNAANTGFANNFHTSLNYLTDVTVGPLAVDLQQNSAQLHDLTTSITNFETQLLAEQKQLTDQFNLVNASLQAYPVLLQEVTATLGTLGSGNTNSSYSAPTLTSGL
jgi:flagellar hook-associated protein 2